MRAISAASRSIRAGFLGLILLLANTTGCRSRTDYGECVGINDADRRPTLHYRLSTRNLVLGIIFVETIFAPLIVLLSEMYCPDGPATTAAPGVRL